MNKNKILYSIPGKLRDIFSLDLRSLALLRIGLALTILYDLCARARYLSAHYTDTGILSRDAAHAYWGERLVFSLHFFGGSAWFEWTLFGIAAIFAVMLLFGYRTKLASVLSWVFIVSIQVRNPMIGQGGDLLLRVAIFWAMFLPLGARYSIDYIKRPILQNISQFASVGIAGYMIQMAFVYFFAALFKIYSPEWLGGTAVFYSLNFAPSVTSLGRYLLQFPDILRVFTLATIWFEMLWISLFFSPFWKDNLRLIGVIGIVFFHLGLAVTINPEMFPLIGIVTTLGFLPAKTWEKIFSWLDKPRFTGLTIYYDGECGFCQNAASYIKKFLLLPQVKIKSAIENEDILRDMIKYDSWVIVGADGKRRYKFDGFIAIAKSSPLIFFLTPLLSLYPVRYIGKYIYEYVASHKKRQCEIIEKKDRVSNKLSDLGFKARGAIIIFLIALVLLWNLATLSPGRFSMPGNSRDLMFLLGINQRWAMFSWFPSPFRVDRWLDISGTLRNGKEVNLPSYAESRWVKYMVRLVPLRAKRQKQFYGEYLCNSWNQSHGPESQLASLSILRSTEYIDAPDPPEMAVKNTFYWKYNCVYDNLNQ